MTLYLIDTNVISELTRPRPDPGVVKFMTDLSEPYVSVVTYHELIFGIEAMKPSKRQRALKDTIDEFMTATLFGQRLIEITEPIARIAAVVRGRETRKGHTASFPDALIAATAYTKKLTVVTRNTADFKYLDVPVFNPWTGT